MWRQIVEPNLDPYVYDNGVLLNDWLGWCLAVAETCFGSARVAPSAWNAWTDYVQVKHYDRNIPSGVFVPIWFSGYYGYGHVAIFKDGIVYSSPVSHKPYIDTWGSIAEVERNYGVSYVGWSEDMVGTRVVEFQPDPVPPVEPSPPIPPVVVPEPPVVVPPVEPPIVTPPIVEVPPIETPPVTPPEAPGESFDLFKAIWDFLVKVFNFITRRKK